MIMLVTIGILGIASLLAWCLSYPEREEQSDKIKYLVQDHEVRRLVANYKHSHRSKNSP